MVTDKISQCRQYFRLKQVKKTFFFSLDWLQDFPIPLMRNKSTTLRFLSLLMLSSPIAVDYAVHWHSLQLIVISYSGLWCRPDLKILFVNRPYLWSVESLAGLQADKPSNSHLPLKRARGSVWFIVFKAPLSSFIIMRDDASVLIWMKTHQ